MNRRALLRGAATASASDTPTVTVERSGYEASDYGSVSGSGSLTIETG